MRVFACIVYDCREGRGVIYREYTECYSISFLFLFFFHQSSLYRIKIFAKCFYLLYTKKYGIQLTGEVVQCEREPLNVADRYAADRYRYKVFHLPYWPCFSVQPFSLMAFSTSLFTRVTACDGRMRESEPLGSGRPCILRIGF